MGKNPSQLSVADLFKAGNEAARQAVEKLKALGIDPVGEDAVLAAPKLDGHKEETARSTRKAS